jgi:DNA-binding MarR family transcriptional regulator
MEAADLVRRDSCPGDKRGLFAVLTETGMATIERIAPNHVDSVRRHFIDRLTPEQLDTLREGYAEINGALREIRARD